MNTNEPTPLRSRMFLPGLLTGVLLGVAGCWLFGWFSQRYHCVEETILCEHMLTEDGLQLTPQTREYLKARYYWNAAHWVSPSWMSGMDQDFGPVDDKLLGGMRPYKEPADSVEVYQSAKQRMGLPPAHKML